MNVRPRWGGQYFPKKAPGKSMNNECAVSNLKGRKQRKTCREVIFDSHTGCPPTCLQMSRAGISQLEILRHKYSQRLSHYLIFEL